MAKQPSDTFNFKLSPEQAQDIYSALACFWEEPQLVHDCNWTGKKKLKLRQAINRFERQLNKEYARTGIEVWPDGIRRTK